MHLGLNQYENAAKMKTFLMFMYCHLQVKFAELTLDTFRMLQCLEWEPTGSFYQKRLIEPKENGTFTDHSGASGLIDMNLAADMTDPTLPPNPRKAILYRPSVTHLIAVSFLELVVKPSGLLYMLQFPFVFFVFRVYRFFYHYYELWANELAPWAEGPFSMLLHWMNVFFFFYINF